MIVYRYKTHLKKIKVYLMDNLLTTQPNVKIDTNNSIHFCSLRGDERKLWCHYFTVDGAWTSWNNWGSCTVTCGSGSQSRARTCTDPSPQYGGADCAGDTSEFKQGCNPSVCPTASVNNYVQVWLLVQWHSPLSVVSKVVYWMLNFWLYTSF